ncbi:GntR family transcriptional regulator [Chitiniphilus purpureus]|uniref:GntR family transcriptional regulator n=1 Tax=Chitiniphilus purpureus TaxID=2981137 RepID=A0ABY6DUQ5_9NEIS|nr:GntR family transcriptional regulator [Chitiniphilus sp. CD1]UXY16791.1 GntR family transcriptional regulator [Chitiniphilus sp. CD1]
MLAQQKLLVLKPDPDSATPLYLQLGHKLAAAINAGFWKADEPLPSERTFCELLGVSRVTARKALDLLFEQGMILRRQGSGTYITPKLEQPLQRLTSLSEMLRLRGFKPGSRWLRREVEIAGAEELLKLNLAPNSRVTRLQRVRLASDTVMGVEETTLPYHLMPDPYVVGDSLYDALRHAKLTVVRAIQNIGAVTATPELAELTGIAPGEALLHLTRVGFLETGVAVELTHSWFRSDYYDLVVELHK